MGLIIIPTCQGFGASLVARLVKNLPAMWETGFDPWVGKIPWRREQLPIPVFCPGEFHGLCRDGKESARTGQLSVSVSFTGGSAVGSPGGEDPLEKEMATHCNVLA